MPDFIEATCIACLSCETVGERLGKVVSVPHPGGRIPQGDTGCIQQARVGISQDVPADSWLVEGPEGFGEGAEGGCVRTTHWEFKIPEDLACPFAEWDDPVPLRSLRRVDAPPSVAGAPDPEEMAVYVSWLERDDLPPTEPRQKDELGHRPMHPRHALDDILDVLEAEGVLTGSRLRDAHATRGQR